MTKATKYVKKPSLIDTLRRMPLGGELAVPERDFKYDYIRHAATRLKKEGMLFTVTCRNILGTKVIRTQ